MNIADRDLFYAEACRVLRQGGRLAVHDVLAGPAGSLHFPTPWSRGPQTSHLILPDEMRRLIESHGLSIRSWRDQTDACAAWYAEVAESPPPSASSPVGLHLSVGSDFAALASIMRRNLDEGRAVVIEAVFEKIEDSSEHHTSIPD